MATEEELRAALVRLIQQLEIGEYVSKVGMKITDNYAFTEAKKVLDSQ